MKRRHQSIRSIIFSPIAVTMLVAAMAVGVVLVLRAIGAMQPLELAAYDWFVRLRANHSGSDPRILVVLANERDIQQMGSWPMSDSVLARAVERLDLAGARAIGLDIYRDIPVPPGTKQLYDVLSRTKHVIVVTAVGDATSLRIEAPPPLRGTEKVAFNDILVDSDGMVRRGLLFINDQAGVYPSLALRLALIYLANAGTTIAPDSVNPETLHLGAGVIRPMEANDGPYVGIDARGYQFLLDFRLGSRPFQTVSLTSLLAGEVPVDAIRNRIAIIGVDAISVKDHFVTPLDRGASDQRYHPGVAVHAHAVSQLLRMAAGVAPSLRIPTQGYDIALIAAFGVMGGVAARRARSLWILGLSTVVGLGALSAGAYVGFTRYWWIPVVPPFIAWLLAAIALTAYLSYREARERAALMALFSRHVSPQVAEAIWEQRKEFADGVRPRSQRLIVTAFFADLAGYTPTAENLSPEQLLDWLNACMQIIAREVGRHGGIVEQYVGDEVVGIFGAPFSHTSEAEIRQDATGAVECALSIAGALIPLNHQFRDEHRPNAALRIGIFTGPAVSGLVGTADRAEYAVIGDTINTASRLESFDKDEYDADPNIAPCRILIGGTTLAYLQDRYVTEFVGERLLKGKSHPVAVHRVLGRRCESPFKHSEDRPS